MDDVIDDDYNGDDDDEKEIARWDIMKISQISPCLRSSLLCGALFFTSSEKLVEVTGSMITNIFGLITKIYT